MEIIICRRIFDSLRRSAKRIEEDVATLERGLKNHPDKESEFLRENLKSMLQEQIKGCQNKEHELRPKGALFEPNVKNHAYWAGQVHAFVQVESWLRGRNDES